MYKMKKKNSTTTTKQTKQAHKNKRHSYEASQCGVIILCSLASERCCIISLYCRSLGIITSFFIGIPCRSICHRGFKWNHTLITQKKCSDCHVYDHDHDQTLRAMLMTLAGLGFRKNNYEQNVATMGQKLTHMTL